MKLYSWTFLVSRKGILTLYSRFTSLAKHKNRHTNEIFMSHQDFLDIQELQMNPLGARIIDAFFADAEWVNPINILFSW